MDERISPRGRRNRGACDLLFSPPFLGRRPDWPIGSIRAFFCVTPLFRGRGKRGKVGREHSQPAFLVTQVPQDGPPGKDRPKRTGTLYGATVQQTAPQGA